MQRSRESARDVRAGGRGMPDADREAQYDLLTAALLGAAVGAGVAMLVGSGRRKPQPLGQAVLAALQPGRKTRLAGRAALAGARMVVKRGSRKAHDLTEDAGDTVREYAEAAREAIDDAVAREVRDLRRAIRKQRKRLGL